MGSHIPDFMKERHRELIEHLRSLTVQDPPAPWRFVAYIDVGGPAAIGFGASSDSDLLLIVTADGRGIVDCSTGEKVARDYDTEDNSWFDWTTNTATGIGPLDEQEIRLGGIHGGGLPTVTRDGWLLELAAPDWPFSFLLLQTPGTMVEGRYIEGIKTKVAPKQSDEFPLPVLAYGFSQTGKSFAVMVDDVVEVFHRDRFEEA